MEDWVKVCAKMLLNRGYAMRGPSEFRYRWRPGGEGHVGVEVRARDSRFRARLRLRRGSSDLLAFGQVLVDADYNLRRLQRWPEILACYHALARHGAPLLLDLGANIGLASIYFAKNFPQARILALEPEPGNFRLLAENVRELAQVEALQAAAASQDGVVGLSNPVGEAWAYRTHLHPASGTGLPAWSIASLLARARANPPFLAKIDIEGFEAELFSRDVDWIDQFPVLIIELHDWLRPKEGTAKAFLRAVHARQRDFVHIGESVYSIAHDLGVHAKAAGGRA